MMVTESRAVELLKQAEDMKLVKVDGFLYHSTVMGKTFFEALNNNHRTRLDNILSEYPPYYAVKSVLLEKSVDIHELKGITGLTEVAVEVILRLLRYIRDDFHSLDEKIFIESNNPLDLGRFLRSVRKAYKRLNRELRWGRPKEFVRVDIIAMNICPELRISIDDFSTMLSQLSESHVGIDIHSEVTGYQFMPFSSRKLRPSSFRKSYLRLRM